MAAPTQVAQSDQYGAQPAATTASPGSQSPAPAKTNAIPFVRASRKASVQDFAQSNIALTAGGTTQIGPFDIQANGFLRGLELYVTASDSGNTATVVYAQDAPFLALTNVTLQDPSSEYIVNPYTGYELMLAEKYFSFRGNPPYNDPRSDPNYFATAGSGGTGGSFTFNLWVPLEDRERDAFCAVPNSAANKNYRFQATVPTSGTIYSTAPTTLPVNLAVQCTNFYWTQPPPSIGNMATVSTPNGNGSVGYLDREVFTAITSQTNPTLIFKNVGRVFKSVLFILRNSSGVREATDWPNPTSIWVNGFPLYYKPTHTWYSEMGDRYGLNAPALGTFDTAGNLDTGVFALYDLNTQPGFANNWGSADQYLATLPSTKVQIVGAWGGSASSLTVLQRTLKPSSGAAMYGSR